MNWIRNLSYGWIFLMLGVAAIASGFSMVEDRGGDRTFLCFDDGCIYAQGLSSIALGTFMIIMGALAIIKRQKDDRKRIAALRKRESVVRNN